ncbi:MAG: transposase [Lentisphaeria bacterium]|nr:transposase [Lentisphaeria bacterium]
MLIPFYSSGFYYSPHCEEMTVTTCGHSLPCLQQPGRFYNICFRLADSIPAHVLDYLLKERLEWRNLAPEKRTLPIYGERWIFKTLDQWLERGLGSRILANTAVSDCVYEEIISHDEIECQIGAFVIMPNHVHLLLKMFRGYDLQSLLERIKRKTSAKIKPLLNQDDERIWMKGSFTRIIRSPAELKRTIKYFLNNPHGNKSVPVYLRGDDRPFTNLPLLQI